MNKQCRVCNTDLIVEDNWTLSRKNNAQYICTPCLKMQRVKYYQKNKKRIKNKSENYYKSNKESISKKSKEYYKKNKTTIYNRVRKWCKNNPEKVKEYGKRDRQKHRGRVNSHSAKRRSKLLQRTVPWASLKDIKKFYVNCPKGYEVDHIIPVQGKKVSGLHVLNNLQYLPKTENRKKGNKHEQ